MSYILDALKKSDQQRQQGTGPNLQTVHRPLIGNNESPLLKLIVSLLVILLLLLGVGGGWYLFKGAPSVPQETKRQSEASTTVDKSIVSGKAKVHTALKSPVVELVPKTVKKINSSALRFNDLDANTRASIPSLTFSFHVYSDNPSRRTIIINNRRVKEGELIEKSLLLEDITPLGVVMLWNNETRFSIDVVESW